MKRVGPFSLEGALILVCAVVVLLGVTRCNAVRDGRRAERVAHLEENAYKASLAGIAARRSTDSLARENVVAAQRLARQVANSRKIAGRLDSLLAQNDAILADTSRTTDDSRETELFVALQRTNEVARLFRDSTDVLLTGVEVLLSAHEAERQAWLAERAANAAESIAKDALIAALRESEQACRILFLPCPSRVQSVGIGAGIVLLLLL